MTRLSLSSLVLCLVLGLGLGVATLTAHQPGPVYKQVASIDLKVGGQAFRSLAFDAKANRLYAGSDLGLFWVNVADDASVKLNSWQNSVM